MLKQIQSLFENMIVMQDYVDTQIEELKIQRERLPKGSVQLRVNGESCYFRHSVYANKRQNDRYISSDEAAKLEGLIQKRCEIEESVKCLKLIQSMSPKRFVDKCKAALEDLILFQADMDEKMQKTLANYSDEEKQIYIEARGTNLPELQGGDKIRLHGVGEILIEISKKQMSREAGKIETSEKGLNVRSKSEGFIFEQLKANGIEFYFEQGIVILGQIIYPDFLIRHPVSGDFLIWEHCGLMSNKTYHDKWEAKLSAYAMQDIRPCSNLILTYEDENVGFSIKHIQDVINFYLL